MAVALVVWGSVAEWVSGVTSAAAVIVALLVAFREARARRLLSEDNDKRAARLVVVGEPAAYPVGSPPRQAIGFSVNNYGDQPIHDLCVELPFTTDDGGGVWQQMRTVLGPRESAEFDFIPDSPIRSSDEPSLWFLDSTGARWRVEAACHEPERVWNYVPRDLPSDIRDEILNSRKERRRRNR